MMKKLITLIFLASLFGFQAIFAQNLAGDYSKVEAQMAMMCSEGVPGMVLGIRKDGKTYYHATGLADIPNKEAMTIDHSQYLQSISKTYIGVSVLQLEAQGKIDLDASINEYLTEELQTWIMGSEKMTVRMMLNHTSGIPEYNSQPTYITKLLQTPRHVFEPKDYVSYVRGRLPDFEPGSDYSYRNTNYVVLALILDELVGDHAAYIRENIFKPLGLEHSYYRESSDYLTPANLPRSYWDRHGNGILEDATFLQMNNVRMMVGDDGIVVTPEDALLYLEGIIELKLFDQESLEKMTDWGTYEDGYSAYGLGLDYTEFAGEEAWGHNGGGIGAGATLHYFPEMDAYVFLAMNLGTVTGGEIHEKLEPELEELYRLILEAVE